jgi:short-subunit dehydrogenase
MPLKGKHIVLTGGTGGIGRLLCGELINAGAGLTIISQQSKLPVSARLIQANLADPDQLAQACAAAAAIEPDILINLAGVQHFGTVESESAEHLHSTIAVNLLAPIALSRAVLPRMRRKGFGQIVNIGSIMASLGCAHFVSYSSAKAGLKGFSEALRRELAGSGVAVTYIAPRAVGAGMTTAAVTGYARATGMTIDEPLQVARKIASAVAARRKDVYFGLSERLYVTLNALAPRLIDAGVASKDRKAAALLPSHPASLN